VLELEAWPGLVWSLLQRAVALVLIKLI